MWNIHLNLLWLTDQIIEKRPVMNHRLPQVFGVRLSARMTKRDFVCRPVVLHNPWVVDGYFRC